jgi:hypothetical protein
MGAPGGPAPPGGPAARPPPPPGGGGGGTGVGGGGVIGGQAPPAATYADAAAAAAAAHLSASQAMAAAEAAQRFADSLQVRRPLRPFARCVRPASLRVWHERAGWLPFSHGVAGSRGAAPLPCEFAYMLCEAECEALACQRMQAMPSAREGVGASGGAGAGCASALHSPLADSLPGFNVRRHRVHMGADAWQLCRAAPQTETRRPPRRAARARPPGRPRRPACRAALAWARASARASRPPWTRLPCGYPVRPRCPCSRTPAP